MVKFYLKRINDGKMTINEVPIRWRSEVYELMETREILR